MDRSLCALAALLLPFVALAAPAPEPFVSGWGNPVDPNKDCKIRRDRGALTIEMPGGDHDYDHHRKRVNAPRLMRDFDGDFEMQVRARIDCRPSAESSVEGKPSYISAGFLIIPPEEFGIALIRLEYRVAGQGDGADGCLAHIDQAIRRGGLEGIGPGKLHPDWPFKGKPDYVYLRLKRHGEVLGCSISADRKKWLTFGGGQKIGLPSKLKVGLAACSTSTDPSKVRFDQLKIIRSITKREPWEFVSGWGDPVDPDKDCKVKRDKDVLTIEMPGSDHDYDPVRKRFNAPRLLSDLEGDFDLEVRVRIDYRPSPQSTVEGQPPSVSAGFLLIYPETDRIICDRLEYAVSQKGTSLDEYVVPPRLAKPRRKDPAPKGTKADSYVARKAWICQQRKANEIEWDHGMPRLFGHGIWERGWQNWPLPEKADCAYLRLEQRDKLVCFFISPDGEKWTLVAYPQILPAKGKVGLAAFSTSTDPSKVRFDQIKLARGKKKE